MTATGADGQTTILVSIAEKIGWRQISGPLFRKYVGLFLAVVSVALLSNGLLEIYFSYRKYTEYLIRIQREQAEGAAKEIGHFIEEIKNQVGWTTQLPWSAATIEQRRFDGLRLLRQVPAITELAQLDPQASSGFGYHGSTWTWAKPRRTTHTTLMNPLIFK